jgi:hypothetical protein
MTYLLKTPGDRARIAHRLDGVDTPSEWLDAWEQDIAYATAKRFREERNGVDAEGRYDG